MSDRLFAYQQMGPYSQALAITVEDHGNELPIEIIAGDDHSVGSYSMTISDAEIFKDQLKKAIKVAKKNNL